MYKTNITGAHRVGNRSDHLVCASFKDPIFGLAKFGYLPTVKSQVTPKRLFSISHCIAVESCAHTSGLLKVKTEKILPVKNNK